VGEGILMRRYAEGEQVGEILGSFEKTVENFYKKFYGIDDCGKVPEERLEFLDRCLELQKIVGPLTCGSQINVYGTNLRRE
jgi:hypothetical protein